MPDADIDVLRRQLIRAGLVAAILTLWFLVAVMKGGISFEASLFAWVLLLVPAGWWVSTGEWWAAIVAVVLSGLSIWWSVLANSWANC